MSQSSPADSYSLIEGAFLRESQRQIERVQAMKDFAIAAERGRCAKIADAHAKAQEGNTAEVSAAEDIAAQIRKGE